MCFSRHASQAHSFAPNQWQHLDVLLLNDAPPRPSPPPASPRLAPHRRCKSFDELHRHFKQLHEREHKKRMGGSKKQAAAYAKSGKAALIR